MPRTRPPARAAKGVISLGPHARLYSEDHFLEALAPFGMTRRAFRAFLSALSVPTLEVGSTRFIDHLSFALALRAILAVGQPDFLAPGSRSLSSSSRKAATSIDPKAFRDNLPTTISALLASHRLSHYNLTPAAVKQAAREATERMILAGVHSLPAKRQAAFHKSANLLAPPPLDLDPS
jgi:hypothetical protein